MKPKEFLYLLDSKYFRRFPISKAVGIYSNLNVCLRVSFDQKRSTRNKSLVHQQATRHFFPIFQVLDAGVVKKSARNTLEKSCRLVRLACHEARGTKGARPRRTRLFLHRTGRSVVDGHVNARNTPRSWCQSPMKTVTVPTVTAAISTVTAARALRRIHKTRGPSSRSNKSSPLTDGCFLHVSCKCG